MKSHVFIAWTPRRPGREINADDREEARDIGAAVFGTRLDETLVRYFCTRDVTRRRLDNSVQLRRIERVKTARREGRELAAIIEREGE